MAKRLDKSKMKCNTPRTTPDHGTKSHVVKACENGKEKILRFGQKGVKKGKMSAAYWANKVKW